MPPTAKHYAEIYRRFQAPISTRYDCGKKCAPLNGGVPFCCDAENAIPVVEKSEWALLKTRSDLWSPLKPATADQRREVNDLKGSDCCAIKCKGASLCERDNRSLACRAFPYFPYYDPNGEFVGLAHYWIFEGSCWVIANPWIVEKDFVVEMMDAHAYLFDKDEGWRDTYLEQSASMRRVFSRRRKKFLVLTPDGRRHWVLPHSGGKRVLAKRAEINKLKKLFPHDTGPLPRVTKPSAGA